MVSPGSVDYVHTWWRIQLPAPLGIRGKDVILKRVWPFLLALLLLMVMLMAAGCTWGGT